MSSDPAGPNLGTQELPSTATPLRELASKEVPHIVHELPSPMPAASGPPTKRSPSDMESSQLNVEDVSPFVGPYTRHSAAAVSDMSLPETSQRDMI